MFVISKKKASKDFGKEIYILAYGFSFFVISISGIFQFYKTYILVPNENAPYNSFRGYFTLLGRLCFSGSRPQNYRARIMKKGGEV
jgi:hypothetical protein